MEAERHAPGQGDAAQVGVRISSISPEQWMPFEFQGAGELQFVVRLNQRNDSLPHPSGCAVAERPNVREEDKKPRPRRKTVDINPLI